MARFADENQAQTAQSGTNENQTQAIQSGIKKSPFIQNSSFDIYAPTADAQKKGGMIGDPHQDLLEIRRENEGQLGKENLLLKGRATGGMSVIWSDPTPVAQSNDWEGKKEAPSRIFDENGLPCGTITPYSGTAPSIVEYTPAPFFVPREAMKYFPSEDGVKKSDAEVYRENAYVAGAYLISSYIRPAIEIACANNPDAFAKVDIEALAQKLRQKLFNDFQKTDAAGKASKYGEEMLDVDLAGKLTDAQIALAVGNFKAACQAFGEEPLQSWVTGTASKTEYSGGTARDLNFNGGEQLGAIAAEGAGSKSVQVRMLLDPLSDPQTRAKDLNNLADEYARQKGASAAYEKQLRQWADSQGSMDAQRFQEMVCGMAKTSKKDKALDRALMQIGQGFMLQPPAVKMEYSLSLDARQTRVGVSNSELTAEYELRASANGSLMKADPQSVMDLARSTASKATLSNSNTTITKNEILPGADGLSVVIRQGTNYNPFLKFTLFAPGGMGLGGMQPPNVLALEYTAPPLLSKSKIDRNLFQNTTPTKPERVPYFEQKDFKSLEIDVNAGYQGSFAYLGTSNQNAGPEQADAIGRKLGSGGLSAAGYFLNKCFQDGFKYGKFGADLHVNKIGPFSYNLDIGMNYLPQFASQLRDTDYSLYNMSAFVMSGAAGISLEILKNIRAGVRGDVTSAFFEPRPSWLSPTHDAPYMINGTYFLNGYRELGQKIDVNPLYRQGGGEIYFTLTNDWLTLGMRTRIERFDLSGRKSVDPIIPSKMIDPSQLQQIITSTVDAELKLVEIGRSALYAQGNAVFDHQNYSRALETYAGFEYVYGHRQGNHIGISAGQNWLVAPGAENNQKYLWNMTPMTRLQIEAQAFDYVKALVRYNADFGNYGQTGSSTGLYFGVQLSIPLVKSQEQPKLNYRDVDLYPQRGTLIGRVPSSTPGAPPIEIRREEIVGNNPAESPAAPATQPGPGATAANRPTRVTEQLPNSPLVTNPNTNPASNTQPFWGGYPIARSIEANQTPNPTPTQTAPASRAPTQQAPITAAPQAISIPTPSVAEAETKKTEPLTIAEALQGRVREIADEYCRKNGLVPLSDKFVQDKVNAILNGTPEPGMRFSKRYTSDLDKKVAAYENDFLKPIQEMLGKSIPTRIETSENNEAVTVFFSATRPKSRAENEAALEKRADVAPKEAPMPKITKIERPKKETKSEEIKPGPKTAEPAPSSPSPAPDVAQSAPVGKADGPIPKAEGAETQIVESDARYESNIVSANGRRILGRMDAIAGVFNRSDFGVKYREAYSANFVGKEEIDTFAHVIFGGRSDPGFNFDWPGYQQDADKYIGQFLTSLYQALKGYGIESRYQTTDILIGGKVVGVNVRLVMTQTPAEIDGAIQQARK